MAKGVCVEKRALAALVVIVTWQRWQAVGAQLIAVAWRKGGVGSSVAAPARRHGVAKAGAGAIVTQLSTVTASERGEWWGDVAKTRNGRCHSAHPHDMAKVEDCGWCRPTVGGGAMGGCCWRTKGMAVVT